MKLSVLFPETRSVDNVVALAQHAEQLGFHGLFLGTAFGFDPVMALGYAGTQTSRILGLYRTTHSLCDDGDGNGWVMSASVC